MGLGLLGNMISVIGYRRPLLMFGVPGVIIVLAGLMLGILTSMNLIYVRSFLMQALTSVGLLLIGTFFCISALTLNSLTLLMKRGIR